MRRIQKNVLVVSIFLVLGAGALLGGFLWTEQKREAEVMAELERERQGRAEEKGAGSGFLEDKSTEPEESPGALEPEEPGEDRTEPVQDAAGEQKGPVTLFFAGDIMLDQSKVMANYDQQGIGGILSEYLLGEMRQADVTVVNEEFPFSTRGTPMQDKQYTFRTDPSYASAFADMGVDVVSLANNHALDFGPEALLDTFAVLDEAGIPYAGAGETRERAAQPVYLERGGRTIGILAASRVIPVVSWNIENQQPGMLCTYDSARLVEAVSETKKHCDYVAVYVHWGVEGENTPQEYQRQLAREYIDAGADLVVGSHPHAPQGIEYYNGKPVVYSLGNFIFNRNDVATYALKAVLTEEGEAKLQVIPVQGIEAKTGELTGQEGEAVLQLLREVSQGVAIDEAGNVTPAAADDAGNAAPAAS